jgi:glycosyltransferase involved in cell wall biosynthesis
MITIFTPAYNRAYTLGRLYESLCRQTCNDFEWLVVDDGSTDNTEQLIDDLIAEHKIPIRYIHKENGGKHTAINIGVKEARGELFFIVDSDDYLTDDAIEWITINSKEILRDKSFAGISGRDITISGISVGKFQQDVIDATALEIRNRYHVTGDLSEIFKTSVLRLFPFPEFEGERFSPEALVWNRIASAGYKLRYYNKGIYVCEYLEDGLTAAITKVRIKSPKATSLYYAEYFSMKLPLLEKLKTAINFWRFAPYYNHLSFSQKLRSISFWTILFYPIAISLYIKDKHTINL